MAGPLSFLDKAAREAYRGMASSHVGAEGPIYMGPVVRPTPENFENLFLESAMSAPHRERVFDQIQGVLRKAGVPDKIILPDPAPFTDPGRGLFDYSRMGNYDDAYLRRYDMPLPKKGMSDNIRNRLTANIRKYVDDTMAGRARAGDAWYDMSPVNRFMAQLDPEAQAHGSDALRRMSAFSAQNSPIKEIPGGFAYHRAQQLGLDPKQEVESIWGQSPLPVHIKGALGLDEHGAYGLKNPKSGEIAQNPKIFSYDQAKLGNLYGYPADTHEIQSMLGDINTNSMKAPQKGVMSMVAGELARRAGTFPASMMSSHWAEVAPQHELALKPGLRHAHGEPFGLDSQQALDYWQNRYKQPFARILEDNLVDRANLLGRDPEDYAADAFAGREYAGGGMIKRMAGNVSMARDELKFGGGGAIKRVLQGMVHIDHLHPEVKDDIAHTLAAHKPFIDAFSKLEGRAPDFQDVKSNILGMSDPIMLRMTSPSPSSIDNSGRSVNRVAVDAYKDMLGKSKAPPILVSGNKLVEGGHRLAAAQEAGAPSIDAIDVNGLLGANWDDYLNNKPIPLLQSQQGLAGGGVPKALNWLRMAADPLVRTAPRSNLDTHLSTLGRLAGTPESKQFIDKQFTNYMVRQFGTDNDPLRKLHEQGKFKFHDLENGIEDLPGRKYDDTAKLITMPIPASNAVRHLIDSASYRGAPSLMRPDMPQWLLSQEGSGKTFHDLHPQTFGNYMRAPVRDVMDYIDHLPEAERKRTVDRISVEDAFSKSHDWHEEMANKDQTVAGEEGTTLHKEYPSGYSWVKVESPTALDNEGNAMGHCVGSYCDKVKAGNSIIYSLRDENGKSHVTVEVRPPENMAAARPLMDITQIRGKQNATPVAQYHPYIRDFIGSGNWGDVEDSERFGLTPDVTGAGKWTRIEQTPEGGLNQRPYNAADETPGYAAGGSVDAAAKKAAQPTDGQRDAGNYRKGHAVISGIPLSIENEAGTKRRPEWPALAHHYGYIKGTVGKDKDHVDAFINPGTPNDYDGPVHIVDQKKKNGHFDEHKVMLGFKDADEARNAYHANYEKGWQGMRAITSMDMPSFKTWVKSGDHQKQASAYAGGGEVKPEWDRAFNDAEVNNGLSPGVLRAMASTESNFNPMAVSKAGALGLMQFMPPTAKGLGIDPHDPIESIHGAGAYLRGLIARFGNLHDALAAYNWGEGNVAKHGTDKLPKETSGYIGKVLGQLIKMPEKPAAKEQDPSSPARIVPRLGVHRQLPPDTMASDDDDESYIDAMNALSNILAPQAEEEEA